MLQAVTRVAAVISQNMKAPKRIIDRGCHEKRDPLMTLAERCCSFLRLSGPSPRHRRVKVEGTERLSSDIDRSWVGSMSW